MAKTRGTGLLMVWVDIAPQYEAEYHRWYDEEHIAHLLAVPGFLSAGRYEALKGSPKYLALYELEHPDVLRSPAFLEGVRFRPSTRRVSSSGGTIGRNYLLNGYRQIFPVHSNPIEQVREPAAFLQMGGVRRPAEIPDALRVRARRGVGKPRMGARPRQQSMEQPHPCLHAARCRLARRLPPALPEIASLLTERVVMPSSNTDPSFLPAHRLAAEIAARRLSPVDIVEALLSRIEAQNPKLHAFIDVYAGDARLAAEAADKAIRSGHMVGPLHGVPIALKDLIDLAGRGTPGGSVGRRR